MGFTIKTGTWGEISKHWPSVPLREIPALLSHRCSQDVCLQLALAVLGSPSVASHSFTPAFHVLSAHSFSKYMKAVLGTQPSTRHLKIISLCLQSIESKRETESSNYKKLPISDFFAWSPFPHSYYQQFNDSNISVHIFAATLLSASLRDSPFTC